MTQIVEILILPPFNLLVAAAAGLILIRFRPRIGWPLTIVALGLLYVSSMPLVGGLLERSLQTYPPLSRVGYRTDPSAIVVLGGGLSRGAPEYGGDTVGSQTLQRVRYGAFLHRATGKPLLVTGGDPTHAGLSEAAAMARALREEFLVPVAWTETASNNTRENAELTWSKLRADDIDTIYLVTNSYHMPRAVRAFERVGFDVVPAPTIISGPMRIGVRSFIPHAGALTNTAHALREWLGRAWYSLRS